MDEKERIAKMDEFLRVAATDSLNSALVQYGEVINAREGAALSKLSVEELKALHDLNTKVTGLSGGFSAAADWTCGVLC